MAVAVEPARASSQLLPQVSLVSLPVSCERGRATGPSWLTGASIRVE